MKVIIGGAYQGKLEYAVNNFGILPEEVCDLRTEKPDPHKTCFYHMEAYVLRCLQNHQDPAEIIKLIPDNAVVISDDISCGIVPMDPMHRACREAAGRLMNTLCTQADSVTRIFCGLPLVLK